MATEEETPALPWGNAAGQTNNSSVDKDLVATKNLEVGIARVEVLWALSPDDDDDDDDDEGVDAAKVADEEDSVETKWWGATILRKVTAEDSSIQSSDAEGRCAYILLYDVDVENGFPEQESAAVTFVNEHELFDISTVDVLSWRMEGSDWEPPPSSADFSIDGERVCNLDDMIKEGEMIERLTGRTLRQDFAKSIENLPVEEQRIIADRVDVGMSIFGQELNKMMDSSAGNIIQLEDVEEMLKKVKKRSHGEI